MDIESLLSKSDELMKELNDLENQITLKLNADLFNNFLNKIVAIDESAEQVLSNMVCDYNNTKKNPTDTNVDSLTIVDNINDNMNEKKIQYEESIINEVQ